MTSLTLNNLNDYLSPAQECVIQLTDEEVVAAPPTIGAKRSAGPALNINFEELASKTGRPQKTEKLIKKTITLSDCLSCSGCLTSAESILVNKQSIDLLLKISSEKEKILPQQSQENFPLSVMISFESLCSLVNHFYGFSSSQSMMDDDMDDMTMNDNIIQHWDTCVEKLVFALKHYFHADFVFDETEARALFRDQEFQQFQTKFPPNFSEFSSNFPAISSNCPGWVCYVEKATGTAEILPLLSKIRSPQQINGVLIKEYFIKYVQNKYPSYHASNSKYNKNPCVTIAISQCYDKKLESKRKIFGNDVDLVLTTSELIECFAAKGIDKSMFLSSSFSKQHPQNNVLDTLFYCCNNNEDYDTRKQIRRFLEQDFKQVDCFSDALFMDTAQKIFNYSANNSNLRIMQEIKTNQDLKEIFLETTLPNGKKKRVLRFLKAYGFRNIQNIVRMIKKNLNQTQNHPPSPTNANTPIHFIEIMSCPAEACLNGNGQIIVPDNSSISKIEYLKGVKKVSKDRVAFSQTNNNSSSNDMDIEGVQEDLKKKEFENQINQRYLESKKRFEQFLEINKFRVFFDEYEHLPDNNNNSSAAKTAKLSELTDF